VESKRKETCLLGRGREKERGEERHVEVKRSKGGRERES